jgi:hypothetical protein
VSAIESKAKQGSCTILRVRVEDTDDSKIRLEHTLTLSNENLSSLRDAHAALEAYRRGNKTNDEEDDGCCICFEWLFSCIGSWFTNIPPTMSRLTFACVGVPQPTTIPSDTTLEDNVASRPVGTS